MSDDVKAPPDPDPPVKAEPQDDSAPVSAIKLGETIDLISEDEDEDAKLTTKPKLTSPVEDEDEIAKLTAKPKPTSPVEEQPSNQPASDLNLGTSILQKPKPAQANKTNALERMQAKMQALRRDTANQYRDPSQTVRSTPAPGRAYSSSGFFVTEGHPGSHSPDREPARDLAREFKALQREMERKRQNGTLSWEEDIQYQRAEDAENARIQKEKDDNAFDEVRSSAGEEGDVATNDDNDEDDDHGVPGLEEESSGSEQPAQNRGRKRKASATSQAKAPPPKKRGRPPKNKAPAVDDTEDVLDKFRRKKGENKLGKGKGKAKEKQASKTTGGKATGGGRKKKPSGPSMLNTLSNNNIFNDSARNAGLPSQPMHAPTGRKDQALKSLIASVPEEVRSIARTDQKFLDESMREFTGRGAVSPADDGNWAVKGMKVTLKAYQILGVAFMRKRENASQYPKGGILADQMGLGKTITTLTNIINGRPLEKSNRHTTLIVASAAIVSQWRREIADKVYTDKEDRKHGIGRVKEYHASAQIRSNQEVEELMECDIVLTTYSQVCKSYPRSEPPPELVTAQKKNEWWEKYYKENRGVLHRVKFHRIVLDEAQAIKNHKSLTSLACRALDAKHHWSISGTIIQNNIEEFYSQFKFLKEPHTGSLKIFKSNFCQQHDGSKKLDAFLRKFMIRRTHLDTLFEARLLDLPKPSEMLVALDMNDVERTVYEIVKARFIARINHMSKAGELEKQYGHIWSMLLRLRQCTSHILLVQSSLFDLVERDDLERLHRICQDDLSMDSQDLLAHLLDKLKNDPGVKRIDSREGVAQNVMETETAPKQRIADPETGDMGGRHGLTYRFDQYLDTLLEAGSFETIAARTLCSGCRQPPLDPHVTSCFHIYCHTCLRDLQQHHARRGQESHRCNECGSHYSEAKRCQKSLDKFAETYNNYTAGSSETEVAGKKAKKAKYNSWIEMKGAVLPSTKTIAVKAQILAWLEEDPDVKIIVYSQWIPMLHILGRVCQTEGWGFEKYTGAMSHDSRNKAIDSFADPNGDKIILLASLKCGGLGLNLTCASRVLSLDPWWNASAEQQAFCRVYRIGQEKETKMVRLSVNNTIDAAINALQDNKQIQIDAAMDNKERQEKVSIGELMRLFGRVAEDDEGRPFIFAEEDTEVEDDDMTPPPPRAAGRQSDDEGGVMVNDE